MTYWNLKQVAPQQTKHHTHIHTHIETSITTPTLPNSFRHTLDSVVQQRLRVYTLLSFFPFIFIYLCLSLSLSMGLWTPFFQQFELYDFILSSFYAFFMLHVAVFSLCRSTNPLPVSSFQLPVQNPQLGSRSQSLCSCTVPLHPFAIPFQHKNITTRPASVVALSSHFVILFFHSLLSTELYYLCII